MSFLEELKIKKLDLTKDLYEKHKEELLEMLVLQYGRKDPSSTCMAYDILYKYFEEEYKNIFTCDKSYKCGFLYFYEDGTFIGNFMMRDAFLSCKNHEKELENMKPQDSNYDYFLQLVKHTNEIFEKYHIKEGDSIYGTNLAFSAKFLEKFPGKKVLSLIFAMFVDLSQWWEKNLKDYKYGVWVQMRQSLSSITEKVFNCVEAREFSHLGDDLKKYTGKLFLVERKDVEELKQIWDKFN